MFTDTGEAANRVMLDNFKSIMKEKSWPMILVLSGVPDLARHIEKERPTEDRLQLRLLLTPIHFEMINMQDDGDLMEVGMIVASYAKNVGVSFAESADIDFLHRLIHGCAYRWGLVIEMLIEAFSICVLSGERVATREHFAKAFSVIHRAPEGFTPFTTPDYLTSFNPNKLMELLERDL